MGTVLRALLALAMAYALAAACTGSDVPTRPASAAAAPNQVDLGVFDADFAAGVTRALSVPLAGRQLDGTVSPLCDSADEGLPTTWFCIADIPADDPVVTITATAAGSMGATGILMAHAAMPNEIEGKALPAPELGDDAHLSRSWGPRGCIGVLAVREGTLIVSVQVRLVAGAAADDCGMDVPGDYLETVAGILLETLHPYSDHGKPVDDPAGRDLAVAMITNGALGANERDIVVLPPELASLSDSGEVIAWREGDAWTIVFFEIRGVVDNYSGWVYRSSGVLGATEDPLGGGSAIVDRIAHRWFHVISN